jgi:hypothetical protein
LVVRPRATLWRFENAQALHDHWQIRRLKVALRPAAFRPRVRCLLFLRRLRPAELLPVAGTLRRSKRLLGLRARALTAAHPGRAELLRRALGKRSGCKVPPPLPASPEGRMLRALESATARPAKLRSLRLRLAPVLIVKLRMLHAGE